MTVSASASTAYTMSVFAKAGTAPWLDMVGYDGTTTSRQYFDLINGVVGSSTGNFSHPIIQNMGNGWYRCSATIMNGGSATTMRAQYAQAYSDGAPVSVDTKNFYLWGAQLEDVTGQSVQTVGDYVSTNVKTTTPYHGANVDGVKYFTTTLTGAAIPDATLKGYLAEGARTNLKNNSEALDLWGTNASPNDASVTANASVAPDGKSTADLIIPSTGTGSHIRYQGFIGAINTTYTFSVYLKAGGYNYAAATLGNNGFASDLRVFVNLTDGTVVGGFTNASVYSVTSAGNGWYRLTVQNTSDANGGNYIPVVEVWSTNNTSSYAGNGTSGVYAWGAQVEQASFASSYIPTTSASVTRAADVLSYPGTGNVNNAAGAISLEANLNNKTTANYERFLEISDNSNNNLIGVTHNTNTKPYTELYGVGGLLQGTPGSGSSSNYTNGNRRMAVSWATNSLKYYESSTLIESDTSVNVPSSLTKINVGIAYSGGSSAFSNIKNVKIWKKALTDTQLTNLTSTNTAVAQSAVKQATVGADGSSFQADLKSTLDLQAGIGKPTFTRADGADRRATVTDFEGLIKPVKANEARFEGARRVENLLTYSEDFGGSEWYANGSVSRATGQTDPFGGTVAVKLTTTGDSSGYYRYPEIVIGNKYVCSVWLKGAVGGETVAFSEPSPGGPVFTLTTSWQRYSTGVITAANTASSLYSNDAGTTNWYVYGTQCEDVTGQANQNPSEYVSTGVKTSVPYHGANVDGVKYFATQNGNTVSSNVVTEATGTAIPDATLHEYVAEGSRTNTITYSEQFDVWAKTAATVTADAAVAPDGKNTADKLIEDTTNNQHRVAQTSTTAIAGGISGSIYLKAAGRNYASMFLWNPTDGLFAGAVVDLTNGSTSSALGTVNVTSVGNGWYRLSVSGTATVTNTQLLAYTRRGTSDGLSTGYLGDGTSSIYFWGAQTEQASFASSYIPTTTTSVTRATDSLSYPSTNNFSDAAGTAYVEALGKFPGQTVTDASRLFLDRGSSGLGRMMYIVSGNGFDGYTIYDGTTATDSFSGSSLNGNQQKLATVWSVAGKKAYVSGTGGSLGSYDGTMGSGDIYIGLSWYGTMRNVRLWKKALTDTQLTKMTSTTAAVSQSAVKKTTVNASQNVKLTTGLVGLWSFNGTDISGTTAYDRSGQNNNGTLTNGPTKTIGKIGQALSFDGVNDYVDTGSTFSTLTSAFSISIWVRPNASQVQYADIIGNHIFGGFTGIVIERDATISDQYYFSYGNGTSHIITNNFTLAANAWYHVVAVKNATGATVYVDGVSVASAASATNASPSTGSLKIGISIAPRYWNGKIDEVRIYNRALSETEVKQLYNLGR